MDLWHIDTLQTWFNHHELVRRVMGVHATAFIEDEKTEFSYQTILDNVTLIDEALLYEINLPVTDAGHKLVKKKDDEALRLKAGSYAVETNIHFPAGLNLLWDSISKCLDMTEKLVEITQIKGWRKIKHLRKMLKSLFRSTSHPVFKGKDEHRRKQYVKQYLLQPRLLQQRVEALIKNPPVSPGNEKQIASVIAMPEQYKKYITKLTDQVERRLIKGKAIAAEEKIYSIFEEHTERISKGKLNNKAEPGHLVLITTDQYQFIADYKVMEKQKDAQQVSELCERIKKNFGGKKVYSHSFDKGFWSKDNHTTLTAAAIEQVILPKRGRHNKEDKERENTAAFKKLRNAHSAVESSINILEHHGLNRCMDKGLSGYKRCVGLSVLACNLHIPGNILKTKEPEA